MKLLATLALGSIAQMRPSHAARSSGNLDLEEDHSRRLQLDGGTGGVPPDGGLRSCDEIIPTGFSGNVLPRDFVWEMLQRVLEDNDAPEEVVSMMESMPLYDVRIWKMCTSCEEANGLWDASHGRSAGLAMPYCVPGTFASGRTMSGLILEPIDPETGLPPTGRVGATMYNYFTVGNQFVVPSQALDVGMPDAYFGAIAAASAGTYTIASDFLGFGEDWEGVQSFLVKDVYQASTIPLLLKLRDSIDRNYGGCRGTELDKRVAIMGYSEGGYATVAVANAIDKLRDGYRHTYMGIGGGPLKMGSEMLMAVEGIVDGTYPFAQLYARLGNAYSSTNQDLVNTDLGQDMASEEYMDPNDPAKNVFEWAISGLDYNSMFPYMPGPPASDMINPALAQLVLDEASAGGRDPCNSEFVTDEVDQLCQALMDNDLSDIIEAMNYQLTFCHSQEDDIVPFENMPNTTTRDNFILMEDLIGNILDPSVGAGDDGDGLKPAGGHLEAINFCYIGYLFPYIDPGESDDVRGIRPLKRKCGYESSTSKSSKGSKLSKKSKSSKTSKSSKRH